MAKKILVAGATGYLGGYVVAELKRRGHFVRALVRPGKKVPGADECFEAEATRSETLAGICDGMDAVISSLGITRQTDKVTFEQVDYGANRALLEEAKSAGVPRFVFVSVLAPDTLVGIAMADARERFVRELQASSVEAAIMRPTGFFSDMKEFLAMAQSGRVWLIGDGSSRMNPIHGEDLAGACAGALDQPPGEHDLGGPETFTYDQIARLAFEVLGKPARISHVSPGLAGAMLKVVRPFSKRTSELGAFLLRVMTHDVVGPAMGTRTLRAFYADEAARASK